MINNFKPMLAAAVKDPNKLTFPLIASPKLDGVRCVIGYPGQPLSRSLKLIPNRWVQKVIGSPVGLKLLLGLDGELIVGSPTSKTVFNTTSSAVMSHDGEPVFHFYVFDDFSCPDLPFLQRRVRIAAAYNRLGFVKEVQQYQVHDLESLLRFEQESLALGYEGIMLRKPDSIYKFGRSTMKEGHLMKLKRFEDGEAVVIGMTELMRNDNEAMLDSLGYKQRSTTAAGMRNGGTMGSLIARDLKTGVQFEIGTGFSAEDRAWFWEKIGPCLTWSDKVNLVVKYKYQPVGVKDKPRFPVYLGIRDRRDM